MSVRGVFGVDGFCDDRVQREVKAVAVRIAVCVIGCPVLAAIFAAAWRKICQRNGVKRPVFFDFCRNVVVAGEDVIGVLQRFHRVRIAAFTGLLCGSIENFLLILVFVGGNLRVDALVAACGVLQHVNSAGQVAVIRERFGGAEQRFYVVVELCVLNLFQLSLDVFIIAEDIGAVHQNGFGTEEIFLVRAALRIA